MHENNREVSDPGGTSVSRVETNVKQASALTRLIQPKREPRIRIGVRALNPEPLRIVVTPKPFHLLL
jgi:hypothetical protein